MSNSINYIYLLLKQYNIFKMKTSTCTKTYNQMPCIFSNKKLDAELAFDLSLCNINRVDSNECLDCSSCHEIEGMLN